MLQVLVSNLAVKGDFITLKVEVREWCINKLVNVPSALNDLKIKEKGLNNDKLRCSSVFKNAKNKKLKLKENYSEEKFPNVSA